MFILGLLSGLVGGSVLPINLETIIGGMLLLGLVSPLNSALGLTVALGFGVAATVKNIVKTVYRKKVEEEVEEVERVIICGPSQEGKVDVNVEEEIHEKAEEEARSNFWLFSSTLTFASFPLYIISLLGGLYTVLLPMSIAAIVWKAYVACNINPKKIAIYGLVVMLVGALAFLTINGGGATMLLYFMGLITIPSIFFNKNKENKEKNKNKTKKRESIFSLDSLLYANNNDGGTILSALLLIQTILWSSGKDVLGTMINGDVGFMLDPYRIAFMVLVILFMFVYSYFFLDRDIENVRKEIKENKFQKKGVSFLIGLGSTIVSVFSFGLPTVLTFVGVGMLINWIAQDNDLVRSVSVPLLLVVGIMS